MMVFRNNLNNQPKDKYSIMVKVTDSEAKLPGFTSQLFSPIAV